MAAEDASRDHESPVGDLCHGLGATRGGPQAWPRPRGDDLGVTPRASAGVKRCYRPRCSGCVGHRTTVSPARLSPPSLWTVLCPAPLLVRSVRSTVCLRHPPLLAPTDAGSLRCLRRRDTSPLPVQCPTRVLSLCLAAACRWRRQRLTLVRPGHRVVQKLHGA